jgi:hypothetical protein
MTMHADKAFLERAIEAIELLHGASVKHSFSTLSFMLAAAKGQAENDLVALQGTRPQGSLHNVLTFGRRDVFGRRARFPSGNPPKSPGAA